MKRLLLAAMLAALAAGVAGADRAPRENVLFEETFAEAPGKGWSWHREVRSHWRIDKERKEMLLLPVGETMLNLNNVPLRDAPDVNDDPLAIEVHVDHVPAGEYEFSGLMWYLDDNHFVVVRKGRDGDARNLLYLVRVKGGKPMLTKQMADNDPSADPRMVVTREKA